MMKEAHAPWLATHASLKHIGWYDSHRLTYLVPEFQIFLEKYDVGSVDVGVVARSCNTVHNGTDAVHMTTMGQPSSQFLTFH